MNTMSKAAEKGKILVFSAPSGGGKSTIIARVQEQIEDLRFSISATTRPPRGTEQHGVEYFFLTREDFEQKIADNEFVEYKNVYENYYGTLKSFIRDGVEQGFHTIFDVDVQGALAIKEQFPQAVLIFIYPPSLEVLRTRLSSRGTDSSETIEKRLTYAESEMAKMDNYDFKVCNNELSAAVEEVVEILKGNGVA